VKIVFLGTSAGWPLPRLGCKCGICQSRDPKDQRLRPVVLVNDNILIDAGPDIYHQLNKFRIEPSKIKALILTHGHYDHILGFYDLTHIYNLQTPPRLFATQEVFNALKLLHRFPIKPFKPEIISPKETIDIDGIKIALYPVRHNHSITYAVKLKERKIFIYIPDLKRIPKNERREFRGVQVLVVDGSSLSKKGQTRIHESIEEGLRLTKDLKPKACYFTHIGHITGTHKQLESFVQREGGSHFHIAFDGLELEI
jgi:phosphoribosyl 1,2-cyclic phosphate phosphodiesterase